MATYQELLAQYNAIPAWEGMGQARAQFLRQHPKFADRLEREGGAAGGATGGGSGGGGNSGSDLPTWYGWGPPPPGYKGHVPPSGGQTPAPGAPGVGEPEETEEETDGLEFIGLTPDGKQEIWRDPETGAITYKDTAQGAAAKTRRENDLFTLYRDTLAQFGFTGEGVEDFLKQSVKEDWNASTFTIKMRQQDWYLANPLYSANLARSAAGGRFMAEAEVLAYADSARQLARHFGFKEPSDAYIAQAIQGGMSVAEFEHRLTVQDRVNQFGGGVAMVYEALMGTSPSDQDLYEIFDPEISTKEFDDRARAAEMRGRPLLLGLGLRSAEEQRALEMLGVTPEAAWEGYQKLAGSLPTISRLAAIDQTIANDPDNPFDSFGALFADIFNPSSPAGLKAKEEILLKIAREQARFRQGGAPVSAGGQAVGLLSPTERASFG